MNCDIAGCSEVATHRAEMVIYAASTRIHPPAIGTLGIFVCTVHATEENANTLLSEPGKRQIEESFVSAGRARPDWARSFVRWKELSS